MNPMRDPGAPAEGGCATVEVGNGNRPDDRSDAIVFAEFWAARHNAELWGSPPSPEPETDPGK